MLAFALASVALMAIPGPDMALIMRNAVVHGRRTGLATMPAGWPASRSTRRRR